MLRLFMAAAFLLAGCASAPSGTVVSARHPATVAAPIVPLTPPSGHLAPVRSPRLPEALRPPSPSSSPVRHGDAHALPAHAALTPEAVASALDAYLAVHAALAADDLAGAQAAADGLAGLPHGLHLVQAADLVEARRAFGALSVGFLAAVDEAGVPEGYELVRFRCGMAQVAEGGVWLQDTGATLNPYFGTAMPSCGTRGAALPGRSAEPGEAHHAH